MILAQYTFDAAMARTTAVYRALLES